MVRDRQVGKFNRLINKNNKTDRNTNSTQSSSSGNGHQVQNLDRANNSNNQSQRDSNTNKWVINLSQTPLTPAQESLLSKSPNFAIAPNNPLHLDLITAIELVCYKLSDRDSQELRPETNCLLRKARAPKANLTREEKKALKELRQDQDSIVLTADKGVATVVLDRKEYIEKTEALLVQPVYKTINKDPTNKLKARLIQTLRKIKRETNMGEGIYRTMYPTGCTFPKFYGLPKIHKTGTPSAP